MEIVTTNDYTNQHSISKLYMSSEIRAKSVFSRNSITAKIIFFFASSNKWLNNVVYLLTNSMSVNLEV